MIVDSYSYYVAAIPAKGKDDCTEELRIWKKKAELYIGLKSKVVKMDKLSRIMHLS